MWIPSVIRTFDVLGTATAIAHTTEFTSSGRVSVSEMAAVGSC